MAAIRIESVTRRFGNVTVLDEVSMDVSDREVVSIVGPSGSGKSTLLRIVAGLDFPSSGRILVDDKSVESQAARERNMAMVFQSYALYPHMTSYENLALNLRLKKLPSDEIDRRVREIAAMLEISELLHKRPKELSGGQRQRVAVGRALIRQPRAFLLDEPLSNLDAMLRERVRHELKALFKTVHAPVIYVTHDQTEAMSLADRVVVLDRGRVQQIGPPEVLYAHPANLFVASFIGTPSMNFFDTELQNGAFCLGGMHIDTGLAISGPITIGVRPSAIRPGSGGTAKVDWIESLGSSFLVGLRVDHAVLTAIVERRPSADIMPFIFGAEDVYVFEKNSGKNLRVDRNRPAADA